MSVEIRKREQMVKPTANEVTPSDRFLTLMFHALVWAVDKNHIPIGLAALDALFAIRTRIMKGELTVADWHERNRGREDFVAIPRWAFDALTTGYHSYVAGEKGVSLGDALGVGKGGQGSRNTTRDGVKRFRRDLGLALQVAGVRAKPDAAGKLTGPELAYLQVAETNDLDPQKVRRAYSKFADVLDELLSVIDIRN